MPRHGQLLYFVISPCRWLFHQNDDERTNVLSYEARVYNIRIWGVEKGQAKECISCSAGSEVSKDGTSCENALLVLTAQKGSNASDVQKTHSLTRYSSIKEAGHRRAVHKTEGALLDDERGTFEKLDGAMRPRFPVLPSSFVYE